MKKKTNIGIWLDKKQAYLITINDELVNTSIIQSNIETFNPKGGYGSRIKYGPSDTVKEKAYLAKEEKQKREFFKRITEKVDAQTSLFIFGPAQMKNDLNKYISEHVRPQPLSIEIENADSMTKNQIIAKVKKYFELHE